MWINHHDWPRSDSNRRIWSFSLTALPTELRGPMKNKEVKGDV